MAVADVPESSRRGIVYKSMRMRGSFPDTSCNSKCNLCDPCKAVEISVREAKAFWKTISIRRCGNACVVTPYFILN